MLLALGCGLAIMVAGAVFLFQLTQRSEVAEPTPIGQVVDVAEMSVTVDEFGEEEGTLRVAVTIGGTEDLDPAADFRLIASGRPVSISSSTCPPVDGTGASCEITFDVSAADGSSRVLFYDRGEERARWVLG